MKYKQELEKVIKEKDGVEADLKLYKEEIEKLKAEKKAKEEEIKKRYHAVVYCTNCMWVSEVSIPPGKSIKDGDCVNCRVRNCLLPVVQYPGKFS